MTKRSEADAVLDEIEATSNTARLRAELEVAEMEDELRQAKANGDDYSKLKVKLRETRRRARTLRDGGDPDEGVARPATVEATARKGK